MSRGIVIKKLIIKGKAIQCRKGVKTRMRWPSQVKGYITHTYISRRCAELARENLSDWAKRRAKIFPAKKR